MNYSRLLTSSIRFQHLEIFFEKENATHCLIRHRHPLSHVHLVKDDARVDCKARIAFEALGQRRLVESGLNERVAESRRNDAALVTQVTVTCGCVHALEKDVLRDVHFALE